jgi:hypothetical protein
MNPIWTVRKRRLARWARQHGVEVPKGYRVATPTCGFACKELIRRVERKAFGPSHVTGVWSKRLGLLVKPRLTRRQRAVQVAKSQIGVKETPANSNSGPKVREYQSTTGAYNAPWCASYVNWVWRQVGVTIEGVNMAYCPSIVAAARANRNGLTVVSRSEAVPGDMPCFDWQRDGISDHIGILTTRVAADGSFKSVEGNTSVGNDSNGGAVMLRDRNARDVQVFVRVTK